MGTRIGQGIMLTVGISSRMGGFKTDVAVERVLGWFILIMACEWILVLIGLSFYLLVRFIIDGVG
jgi:hypothetical protein